MVLSLQLFALNQHELFEVSNIINSSLPQYVDEHTLFVNCVSGKNKLRYSYVVTSFKKNEIDVAKRKAIEEQEQLKVCQKPNFKPLFDQNITLVHRFLDKQLVDLFEVTITPKACRVHAKKKKKR